MVAVGECCYAQISKLILFIVFFFSSQGYGWSQWENDVRRWEMETGLSYEQVCCISLYLMQRPVMLGEASFIWMRSQIACFRIVRNQQLDQHPLHLLSQVMEGEAKKEQKICLLLSLTR